jgi:hypothetical protein
MSLATRMEECPSRRLIVSMCAPASIINAAALCRRSWKCNPTSPARRSAGDQIRTLQKVTDDLETFNRQVARLWNNSDDVAIAA